VGRVLEEGQRQAEHRLAAIGARGHRRAIVHWITGAKRGETQARRLAQLIAECAAGRRIGG